MSYSISVRLTGPFAPTVERIRASRKEHGFGVLTETDVRATPREKIGADIDDYLILSACNPPLAHRALDTDREIGLLPCNVIVRTDGPRAHARASARPTGHGSNQGRSELKEVADEASTRLRAALDTLAE
jgi:uncharacterized protein (DUF302 family)